MRAMTGLVDVNQGERPRRGQRPAPRPRGAPPARARARGRSGAGRAHRPPVRALRRRPPRRRRPRARPTTRCESVGMLDVADRRVDTFSKGMRQRTKVAAALVCDPARARARRAAERRRSGAAPAPHRAVPASSAREGRTVIVSSHVLQRGRAARRARDRAHPRPARRRRRAPRDPRRDGRSAAARARPRSDAPRRLAAALIALDVVSGVTFDASQRLIVIEPSPRRRDRAASARPRRSTRCSKRCARSTTRSRACSGSS